MPKFYKPTDSDDEIIARALLLGMNLERRADGFYISGASSPDVAGNWGIASNGARAFLRWKAGEPHRFSDFVDEPNVRTLRD